MAFFEFPHTRTYDSDLGWIIQQINAIKQAVVDAQTAQELAENAQRLAELAQAGAETAQAGSEEAQRLAELAQAAAELAQQAAEAAEASAKNYSDHIADPVGGLVTSWLNAHVNPVGSAVVVDDTLSITGAAADSRTVGETFTLLGTDVSPLGFTVDSIDDNQNKLIYADGSVSDTVSMIGVSDPVYCREGAILSYKLSSLVNTLVLAVYGAGGTLNHSVTAEGYSTYSEGTYTFTDQDRYFRIAGVITGNYRQNYLADYSYFPANLVRKSDYDGTVTRITADGAEIRRIGRIADSVVIDVSSIDDNQNYYIGSDGALVATTSTIGTSDLYNAKEGAVLNYKLSSWTDSLVLAVYDADGVLTHSAAASGYSTYITGSYTFTAADAFFRIAGVFSGSYRPNYSVTYSYFPPLLVRKSDYENDIMVLHRTVDFNQPTEAAGLLTELGGIRSTNGTINPVTNYYHSDYIPLQKDSVITYTGVRVSDLCAIAPYDEDKVYDAANAVIASTTISGTWSMPYDGYVRLCCRDTELAGGASFVIVNPFGLWIQSLGDEELPEVWQTYIDGIRPSIKAALVAIGSTGEAFTFVTDCHVPRNNMLTPEIIRELDKDCPVNFHINGGDFLDINTDSAQSAIDDLWKWKDAMHGITEYCLRGNHDLNNYDNTNPQNELTIGQFYAVMDRQIEDIVDTRGTTYYCIDNESQKIRIVVLDSSLTGAARTSMFTWMAGKLTELSADWTILVVQHYLWGSTTETIHANGQAIIDAINAVYAQISASFIGILAGHTHVDHNDTEAVNGYLLIARDTNMVKGGTGTNSLSFDYVTINTSAKSITFTKIGRGSNLTLTYS